MMKNNNFTMLYIILILNAIILTLTGIFLGKIFGIFGVHIPSLVLIILEIAFIISGLFNIWLVFYAKKKLS